MGPLGRSHPTRLHVPWISRWQRPGRDRSSVTPAIKTQGPARPRATEGMHGDQGRIAGQLDAQLSDSTGEVS